MLSLTSESKDAMRMKKVLAFCAILLFSRIASAENADDYRGGWRTESGDPYTFEFSIRKNHFLIPAHVVASLPLDSTEK